MQVKPFQDRILVERAEAETMTASGLVIPTSGEKPSQGKVLAVGSGHRTPEGIVPLEVKEGDTVIFGQYTGTEIKSDDKDLLIMKEDEILGTIQ